MKKSFLATLLVFLVAMLGLITGCESSNNSVSETNASAKVILILEDGSEEAHDINISSNKSLKDSLYDAKLIDDQNHDALFVETINGHLASMEEGFTWIALDENKKTGSLHSILPIIFHYSNSLMHLFQ